MVNPTGCAEGVADHGQGGAHRLGGSAAPLAGPAPAAGGARTGAREVRASAVNAGASAVSVIPAEFEPCATPVQASQNTHRSSRLSHGFHTQQPPCLYFFDVH